MAKLRIGHGYDAHRLVPDRRLVLGGVTVPHTMGLLGHSDADVLAHVVMDALLGALALGDIGKHFPDTDPAYQDADSMQLLRHCIALAAERGYALSNLDATILAQKPKLAPYLEAMRRNLADVFAADPADINVKATTEEGMGYTGREEGIAAHCVLLLVQRDL